MITKTLDFVQLMPEREMVKDACSPQKVQKVSKFGQISEGVAIMKTDEKVQANRQKHILTFRKRLEWQISEGVAIMKTNEKVQANRQKHILMNSKSEHKSLQPAVHRQITIRGVRNGS